MAEIWKPRSKEVLQHWIDTILDESSDKLNDWENSFVDNMNHILFMGQLTEAQENKLEELYVKYTS